MLKTKWNIRWCLGTKHSSGAMSAMCSHHCTMASWEHTHVGSLSLKLFARVFYVSLQSKRVLHVGGLHDPLASPPDTVEALQVLSRAQESGAKGRKAVKVAA